MLLKCSAVRQQKPSIRSTSKDASAPNQSRQQQMSMLLNSPASMVVLLVTAASSKNDASNLVTFYGPNGSK